MGKFIDDEMEKYVHDGMMPMTLSMERPCNACVSIEELNRGGGRCLIA